MKTVKFDNRSSFESIEFRQAISGPVAVMTVAEHPAKSMANFPDTLRKMGMEAEGIFSGLKPALRVSGFESEQQLLDAVSSANLGTVVAPAGPPIPEPSHAQRLQASREAEEPLRKETTAGTARQLIDATLSVSEKHQAAQKRPNGSYADAEKARAAERSSQSNGRF